MRDRIQLKTLVMTAVVVLATGLDITTHIAFHAGGMYVITTGDISEPDYATLGAGAMFRV